MSLSERLRRPAVPAASILVLALPLWLGANSAMAQTSHLPITPEWRDTANRVAQAGVPLSDLAPNARGETA